MTSAPRVEVALSMPYGNVGQSPLLSHPMLTGETDVEHISSYQTARYAFDLLAKRKARAQAAPFTVVVISLKYVTECRALSIQMCHIQTVRSAVSLEIFFGAKDAHVYSVCLIPAVPQRCTTDPTLAEDSLDLPKE